MTNTRKYWGVSLLILAFSFSVKAAELTCTPTNDCVTLGYIDIASECSKSIQCPFDTSKVICLKKLVKSCEVGSILYSDKSCDNVVVSGKTPIGIIFNKDIRLAVALEQSSGKLTWGGYGTNIPALDDCYPATSLTCGTNGKANTAAIIAYGKANSLNHPAAEYCNKYTTAGTKAGDWYLPSMAELKLLSDALTQVNASLQLLGKKIFASDYPNWSSTEFDKNDSLTLYIKSNSNSKWPKNNSFDVLPVITY